MKKDLQVSKAKATRLENARDRPPDNDYCEKDDEIQSLKDQIVDLAFQKDKEILRLKNENEDLEKRAYVSPSITYVTDYFCSPRRSSKHAFRPHLCDKHSDGLTESPRGLS